MTTDETHLPSPLDRVRDQHLTTAEDLLNALRSKTWGEPQDWIYRGHANADWKLQPSAFRSPMALEPFGVKGDTSNWSPRELLMVQALDRFREGLDSAGVTIPTEPPVVDTRKQEQSHQGRVPRSAYPLMALAQHHGLPTLLLDWTRRGPVAAYMAAATTLDPNTKDPAPYLAVWALRARSGQTFGHQVENEEQTRSFFRVYQAPAGTNPNMRAQAGLHTLVFGYDDPGVETIVARRGDDGPELRRLTLPRTQAPTLLRLLANEGISGASMFPGADGVVRAMREESWWDRPVQHAPRATPWSRTGPK